MNSFRTRAPFFPLTLLLTVSLTAGCGEVITIDEATDDAATSSASGGSTGGSGGGGPSGGSGTGGAPSCPSAEGVIVVGCGFHSNAVVLDGADGAVYVLDAEETENAFAETLWRLDLGTHERTPLYQGLALTSPLDRTRSFARGGDAYYFAALQDEYVILRAPLDGGPASPIVFSGVAEEAHVVADPFSSAAYFESVDGVSRVDALGEVTIVSSLRGELFGASIAGAGIASEGVIHVVEAGVDTVYGSISPFGAAHADLRGGYIVAPTDAGLGGNHELRGFYPDGEGVLTHIPDGEGAGPPRFVRQGVIGGEINIVVFQQGSEQGGLVYRFTGEDPAGLFGEAPAIGGGRVFRGPAVVVESAIYAAGARAVDGGDPVLEGAIAILN